LNNRPPANTTVKADGINTDIFSFFGSAGLIIAKNALWRKEHEQSVCTQTMKIL
jgi:hypothetical protein